MFDEYLLFLCNIFIACGIVTWCQDSGHSTNSLVMTDLCQSMSRCAPEQNINLQVLINRKLQSTNLISQRRCFILPVLVLNNTRINDCEFVRKCRFRQEYVFLLPRHGALDVCTPAHTNIRIHLKL